MKEKYLPNELEPRVQKRWHDEGVFRAVEDDTREKFYCLVMFPYPSGKLHMGHVRNYTIGDVIGRYQRMLGKNVLQPMGWDAFGLPAENAAIQNKTAPAKWTRENISYMRNQLQSLGYGYDWERELATCDVDYYRWEQWFFTRLMERGLAYKKEAEVNWDPVDQTVLANEQVENGRGWRSGALIERKKIPQWFLRITDYAEELLQGLDELDGWPDSVRTMQRNWIGKSVGVEAVFKVEDAEDLRVFTTRADTIMGVTYLAVAAQHPLAMAVAADNPEVDAFVQSCNQQTTAEADLETMEKLGMSLGVTATHPVTGDQIPVWVANFVLMAYGTGAVMAVPAHDQRDWEFATRYGIDIKPVIFPADSELDISEGAYVEPGILKNSGEFDGIASEDAKSAIAEWLQTNDRGERQVNYRLRDWGISRQRYWGCPIPVISEDDGNTIAVVEQDLPVELPENVVMEGVGSPLNDMPEFVETTHPHTGEAARRETDTFDTFVESSWYYARFCSPNAADAMLDARAHYWLPVDQYVGGIEHAVMHLLYARFFHRLMRDEGLVEGDEPFTRLLTQGMVIAETYYRENGGRKEYFNPADVDVDKDDKGRVTAARLKADGEPVIVGGIEKMSKSKNNGVDPQSMIDRFGADTVRLFMMFASPPDQSLEWSDEAVAGASRFLRRVWNWFYLHQQDLAGQALAQLDKPEIEDESVASLRRTVYTLLDKALRDYERQQFNTVVAACMELTNHVERFDWDKAGDDALPVMREAALILLKLLAPIAPHIVETVAGELDARQQIENGWLTVDETALKTDSLDIVVQVNGKLRGRIKVAADAAQDVVEQAALADENVARFTENKTIRKVIVVPGKLVNIVAAD